MAAPNDAGLGLGRFLHGILDVVDAVTPGESTRKTSSYRIREESHPGTGEAYFVVMENGLDLCMSDSRKTAERIVGALRG